MMNSNNQSGFTLVEVMLAAAIVGIFSSFMIINFRINDLNRKFDQVALVLLNDIKEAQSWALSSYRITDDEGRKYLPDTYEVAVSQCLSGECQYQIIAQENGNSQILKSKLIPPGVIISSESVNIFFEPPRAMTVINGSQGQVLDQYIIEMSHKDSNINSKCIQISAMSGRVGFINCP